MSVLNNPAEGGLGRALRRLPEVNRAAHRPASTQEPPTNWPMVALGVMLAGLLVWGVSRVAGPIMVGA
jgi:uncharacterized protein